MTPIWRKQRKSELHRFIDGTSYLYIEHTVVEVEDRSLQFFHPEGMVSIPAAWLAVLLLGPGTSISHAAVSALASVDCSIVWLGEEGVRFYASGRGKTEHAKRTEQQARLWADPKSRERVARRMYAIRFGELGEAIAESATIAQLRGYEGQKVAEQYSSYAAAYGVKWRKRIINRNNLAANDPANSAITVANQCLYGLAHAAIVSCGYTPALGFIHCGHMDSLVYDIADLYKASDAYRIAFSEAAEGPENLESRVRHALREHFRQTQLLKTMANDLLNLLEAHDKNENNENANHLYDPNGNVAGGKNYGY